MDTTEINKRTEQLLTQELAKVIEKYHNGSLRAKAIKQLRREIRNNNSEDILCPRLKCWLMPNDHYQILVFTTLIFFAIGGVIALINRLINCDTDFLHFAIAIPLGDLFFSFIILLASHNDDNNKCRYRLYIFLWLVMIVALFILAHIFTPVAISWYILTALIIGFIILPMLAVLFVTLI